MFVASMIQGIKTYKIYFRPSGVNVLNKATSKNYLKSVFNDWIFTTDIKKTY